MTVEHIYKVGTLLFDNLQDAEIFDNYSNIFNKKQLKEIYNGYLSKIDYKVYANPKFNAYQMKVIREAFEDYNIDLSNFANPDFTEYKLIQIRKGIEQNLDVSIYAKPEYTCYQMEEIRLGLLKNLDVKIYSDPNIKAEDMERIRKELEKNIDNSNIDWFAEIQRIKLEMESKK